MLRWEAGRPNVFVCLIFFFTACFFLGDVEIDGKWVEGKMEQLPSRYTQKLPGSFHRPHTPINEAVCKMATDAQ
jgi:hypothetical protein